MTNRGRGISLKTESIYRKVEFLGCTQLKPKNAIIDMK